jgi:hypothetical protein
MKDSLTSQREMKRHIELFDGPPNNQEDSYFEKKMRNFYEAHKMENRVNNYKINHILNNGSTNARKRF